MNENNFVEEVKKFGINPSNEQLEMLRKYADFLISYNEHTNLTAIKDIKGIYLKHFYDSILIAKYYNFNKVNNLIDVGTGAGFPGLVIKIFFPHIKVDLLDSNNKKITFLQKLIKHLNLENIGTINERAEKCVEKNRGKYDVAIARAVSELRIISELCLPFVKVGGNFIAMKAKYEEEITKIDGVLKELNSSIENIFSTTLPIENSVRSLIIFKVNKKIDLKYPRLYDQIIKKELK